MLRTLKNRAHEWLKVKKDADRVDEQTRENEALRANQTMLEEQLEALSKKMEAMAFKESANMEDELDKAVEGKRKPGRPRKTDNE
jgi:cell division protein FtsB